ncbi:methylglyoxal reductase (NADPH-dependent) gre2 [Tulasnella sp. 417]|nr:methylglyoxal reductase (NADPH-dependent) gre2 [Tulasnella sp. 417]
MSTVLLTGVNGFVAATILQKLLARGHTVVGTVRSESKTKYIREQHKAAVSADKLKFAIVDDITVPGAFDEVLRQYQFDTVLHTSSPFHFNVTDIAKELYEPAVQGTTSILESIHKVAPSVKRVVLTSSFASVVDRSQGNRPGKIYTEADWNPTTSEEGLKDVVSGYYASKKLAETAAWDFMKEKNPSFTLTALCPPMVYGPPEQEVQSMNKLNTSDLEIYNIFNGGPIPSNGVWIWVDVRDLAEAHVLAIDAPAAANQRYITAQGNYSFQMFADYMWKNYPERAAAKGLDKGNPGKYYPDDGNYGVDNSKSVKELGLKYTSVDDMLRDTLKKFEELEAEGK